MITIDLSNQVILVTGGSKGVGRGICEAFLEAGATVIAAARHAPQQLPAAADRAAVFHELDVCNPEAVQETLDSLRRNFGRLDCLVNNAGGTPFREASKSTASFSERVVRLNLLAPFFVAQQANSIMQTQETGGLIINIASISGLRASPGTAVYGASKAGLINLTKSLAVEWAPRVRVNALAVGMVKTEQAHLHYGNEEGIAAVSRTIPIQRMAVPRDVGDLCTVLASSLCNYVSGSCITIDGGGELPAFLDAANTSRNTTA